MNILYVFLFALVCHIRYASSWSSVRISTCDAPVLGTPLSLCCHTENLPKAASIYFSNSSGHVVRIGQSCDLWYPSNEDETYFSWDCSTRGNVSVYSLTFQTNLSKDDTNETWVCGFYGNKSETTITVLDNHSSSVHLPDSNPVLQYTLPSSIDSSQNIRLYVLHSNKTLLEVNASSNTVISQSPRVRYIGDIAQKNFSVEVLNIQRHDNGSYVCEYKSSDGEIVRLGQTIVVLGKPKMLEIRNSTTWESSGTKISGSVTCNAISGSAAPLFYNPNMIVDWIVPSADDWPKEELGYNVSSNGSSLHIFNIDCSRSLLPVYCRVSDDGQISDNSQAFIPNTMCVSKSTPSEETSGDPTFRRLVIGICISVSSTVFIFTITIVVARRHLQKRLKKCCRCFRGCCKCCLEILPSSDSDSDSDLEVGLRRSRRELGGLFGSDRRRRDDEFPDLADGLRPSRDSHTSEVQRALERIAIEESRQNYEQANRLNAEASDVGNLQNLQPINEEGNPAMEFLALPNIEADVSGVNLGFEPQGAVGGAPRSPTDNDLALLKEVESLLEQHHRHLGHDVIPLHVSRENIVENLIGYYTEERLAMSRVTVKFAGEDGMDCGGLTYDMFTTFWSRAQEEFFLGCESVVPFLPSHRFTDDSKYRTLGRILSHSIAVLKTFPIPICKSTIIAMIYETTDVSADTVLEDFLYFLDEHDRSLVTAAINDFSSLTEDQTEELMTVFERFDYAGRITADNFKHHVTLLARNLTCIRPRPLLDLMRAGIPASHFEHFWSRFHLKTLDVLFRALKPTPERVISRLKISDDNRHTSRRQERVLKFLKDLLKEMSEPEIETFLQFVTGKKSIPRDKITIEFTTDSGKLRLPKAHTCSNMMELPETYEDYDTFRSEIKHLLASDEALKMSME